MYTVQIPADLKFNDLDRARAAAQALEQLLDLADVRTGGVILRTENYSLLPLVKPVLDRSKWVTGGQGATDELNRLIKEIEALASDEPGEFWDRLRAKASTTGLVDIIEVQEHVTRRLNLPQPFDGLAEIVGKIAAAQAARSLQPPKVKRGS